MWLAGAELVQTTTHHHHHHQWRAPCTVRALAEASSNISPFQYFMTAISGWLCRRFHARAPAVLTAAPWAGWYTSDHLPLVLGAGRGWRARSRWRGRWWHWRAAWWRCWGSGGSGPPPLRQLLKSCGPRPLPGSLLGSTGMPLSGG
jgi:hypothetical protein